MQEPMAYALDYASGTIGLSLTPERLTVKTQGKGLLDKPRTIAIAPSDLEKFCLVPVIAAQTMIAKAGGDLVRDAAYDSEFIFSYKDGGKLKKKRLFVSGRDEAFQRLLKALGERCPAASLLHLDPAEAQRQIGVMSATRGLAVVIGVILGIPVIIALVMLLSAVLRD